jgi:glutamate synthase (NADPH/NADH)
VLRKKFEGKPEHVVNFFFMLAEEIRTHMAKIGIRRFQDLIGKTEYLKVKENNPNPKARYLDFGNLLKNALWMRPGVNIVGGSVPQDFELEKRLDNQLLAMTAPVLEGKQSRVDIEMDIVNSCRAFASTLSYHIAK